MIVSEDGILRVAIIILKFKIQILRFTIMISVIIHLL